MDGGEWERDYVCVYIHNKTTKLKGERDERRWAWANGGGKNFQLYYIIFSFSFSFFRFRFFWRNDTLLRRICEKHPTKRDYKKNKEIKGNRGRRV